MLNQFSKKIKTKNKFREFIQVLNGLLRLSDRETEVLSLLMKIDSEWTPVISEHKNILSTDSRRAIMKETRITKNNLVKYIRTLKERGILIQNSFEGYEINNIFMPKATGDIIEIVFILDYGKN